MSEASARDNDDLAEPLAALKGTRVLVAGDVMLDRFVYGAAERISPEAPIPVLRVSRETSMLGGAGTVLRNLSALGVRTSFHALFGEDAAGQEVQILVEAEVAVESRLLLDPKRPTCIKERYIASGQQLLRADRESLEHLDQDTAAAFAAAIIDDLGAVDAVVLSDYGKGALGAGTLGRIIDAAKDAAKPVVVDPKGRDYGLYRGADLVTPNRRELHQATGLPVSGDEEIEAACRALIESAGVAAVLATRSEQGMTLVTRQGRTQHLSAEAREVFDVSGAGDTVVAIMGASLGADIPLPQAARLANVAAGVVVAKAGTAVAHTSEVMHALRASDLMAAESKVIELDDLLRRVAQWRQAGLSVGFTNGCFDLLHPGHVALLRQSRAACDRLVVGLNSDASVARLKGPERPIQGAAARAAVLASLADVDQVVIFDQDTPRDLIAAIEPDVLVKGADYSLDQVVGADIVQGRGGRVLLADLAPGHSTSATIKKLGG